MVILHTFKPSRNCKSPAIQLFLKKIMTAAKIDIENDCLILRGDAENVVLPPFSTGVQVRAIAIVGTPNKIMLTGIQGNKFSFQFCQVNNQSFVISTQSEMSSCTILIFEEGSFPIKICDSTFCALVGIVNSVINAVVLEVQPRQISHFTNYVRVYGLHFSNWTIFQIQNR